MMRWGHVSPAIDIARVAHQIYRPDLHAAAASDLGRPVVAPLDGLADYSPLAPFRIAEARDHATNGALSRIRAA